MERLFLYLLEEKDYIPMGLPKKIGISSFT